MPSKGNRTLAETYVLPLRKIKLAGQEAELDLARPSWDGYGIFFTLANIARTLLEHYGISDSTTCALVYAGVGVLALVLGNRLNKIESRLAAKITSGTLGGVGFVLAVFLNGMPLMPALLTAGGVCVPHLWGEVLFRRFRSKESAETE
ncbi:hypothetical protein ACFY1U_45880 [Streptomyces sp. NPDC001351]|uniref:hypothetical protein n=1 Tax=Streptomyces sp. NPDC001351 TaxID=3364564 RepID=UPI0036C60AB2